MPTDNIKISGPSKAYTTSSGGATLITEPVRAVVKNNIDPTRSGRIEVYLSKYGGNDPDDSKSWVTVRYLSPFYGITSANYNPEDGSDKDGFGKFVGNPSSYGFWASAPDIGTAVICVFVDGRIDQGYYIGCIPETGLIQMTPAIGASSSVIPNESEGSSYGGCDRLPTNEVNVSNPAIQKSATVYNEAKPVHSYQAAILASQGIIRDNVRGVISSSAQRESPSRVFGMSTPGGPIFEGGYTGATIKDAAKSASPEKLKQVGRTGGHTFVMDDGTLTGQDQLIRLRSSAGHQITMSDSGQTLFIIHSNGQSWIEMGKEGTIDIYSTNSFNVRTQGDINFHADRNININAAKNLNLYGENINLESSKNYTQRVGVNYSSYTLGKYTVKVDGAMSQQSSGQASYRSSAETFINGSKVNLNSGTAGLQPASVPPITKTSHTDTTNSPTVGWMNPSTEPLVSITNRAPAHQPWIGSGTGVDVQIKSSPTPAPVSTPAVDKAMASVPPVPTAPVNPAQIASAPSTVAAGLPTSTAQAVVASVAAGAQTSASAVLTQATGATAKMAEAAGAMKPGSADHADKLRELGMPTTKALSNSLTGAISNGAAAITSSVTAGAAIVGENIRKSVQSLTNIGVLTGKEGPIQTAGLVMGAVTSGVKAVKDFVDTGVATVTGLVDKISSGAFAAKMADGLSMKGLSASLDGLKASIGGKLSELGGSVTGLADKLRTGLQSAFASVEASFGKLKAGMPNILGGGGATPDPLSAVADAGRKAASAAQESLSAVNKRLQALRDFRNDPSPANQALLQSAEAAAATAVQKATKASSSLIDVGKSVPASLAGGLSGVTGALGAAADSITGAASQLNALATSVTSGLGSLPGAGGLQAAINMGAGLQKQANSVISSVNTLSSAVSSAAGGVTSVLGMPGAVAGNLVAGAESAIKDVMSKAGDLTKLAGSLPTSLKDATKSATDAMAGIKASLGSIAGGVGDLTVPPAATGTFDIAALTAKTGQLLGDPKIPSPLSVGSSQSPSDDADSVSGEISTTLAKLEEAESRVRAAKLNLSITRNTVGRLPGGDGQIAAATAALKREEDNLSTARISYASLIR